MPHGFMEQYKQIYIENNRYPRRRARAWKYSRDGQPWLVCTARPGIVCIVMEYTVPHSSTSDYLLLVVL